MKLTVHLDLTDDELAAARDYAARKGVRLATAIARLLVSGCRRLDASRRYQTSPKGPRVRRLAAQRRASREQLRRERASRLLRRLRGEGGRP